jgi:hypothetical protein
LRVLEFAAWKTGDSSLNSLTFMHSRASFRNHNYARIPRRRKGLS